MRVARKGDPASIQSGSALIGNTNGSNIFRWQAKLKAFGSSLRHGHMRAQSIRKPQPEVLICSPAGRRRLVSSQTSLPSTTSWTRVGRRSEESWWMRRGCCLPPSQPFTRYWHAHALRAQPPKSLLAPPACRLPVALATVERLYVAPVQRSLLSCWCSGWPQRRS